MGCGPTQAELACRAKIGIPTMRALEKGSGAILTLEANPTMAEVFGRVDVTRLFG